MLTSAFRESVIHSPEAAGRTHAGSCRFAAGSSPPFLDFVDPFELREAEEIAERKELQRLREIEKVRIVLSMMKPAQERRLYKFVIEGKSCREIAVEEGTYHSSVSKSIEAAKKSFKKIYKNL